MAILDFYHDTATMQQRVHSGVWANQTVDDYLQQHVRQRGDKAVLVNHRWRDCAMRPPLAATASKPFFSCGGAPIPRELIKYAEDEHSFFVSALYGSSEALVNTAVTPDDALEQRHGSDGKIIPGVEARLVHPETGAVLPAGAEGELQVRTPVLFAGYYKDPERTQAVCSPDGWYSTGDLCVLNTENYVSVVGRKKDMIIRGGANISAREIEAVLFTHPKIANVACVAIPDPVLAERVCAYVICRPGASLTFDEMIDFLKTPSGKIQKYRLRAEIAALVGHKALVR
jgi:cyclohexanecarboxylate-CoA ligase